MFGTFWDFDISIVKHIMENKRSSNETISEFQTQLIEDCKICSYDNLSMLDWDSD